MTVQTIFVSALIVGFSSVAFAFAVIAEQKRSIGTAVEVQGTNDHYCVYYTDMAAAYGFGALLFLLSSESLLMGFTRCKCSTIELALGGNRNRFIYYFPASWVAFLVATGCLFGGAAKTGYLAKLRNYTYTKNNSCDSLQKGVFIAGAVFVVVTAFLNMCYFKKVTEATPPAAPRADPANVAIEMAQPPQRADPANVNI